MVQMNSLIALQALSSSCPYSKHLTLNRMDKIIGTRKAMYALNNRTIQTKNNKLFNKW